MHSYSPAKQQLIVTACCALHNFIHMHNWSDNLFHACEEQDVESITVCDTNNSSDARVGSGRNEEAFNQQAQRAMT